MWRDRADERQDNRVADQQQPAKREQADGTDMLLQLFAARQHLRDHVGERNPDRGGEQDAQHVGANGQASDAPVKPERSIEAYDQQRENKSEGILARNRNRQTGTEAQCEQDGREQPAQFNAELKQHGPGKGASQMARHARSPARDASPGANRGIRSAWPRAEECSSNEPGSRFDRPHGGVHTSLPNTGTASA